MVGAVDTAGAVARAMERAYRQGFEDAQSERRRRSGSLPKPRRRWTGSDPAKAEKRFLDAVPLHVWGARGSRNALAIGCPRSPSGGTPGWKLVSPDGGLETTIAGRGRSFLSSGWGLWSSPPTCPRGCSISDLGRATWRLFLKRGGEIPGGSDAGLIGNLVIGPAKRSAGRAGGTAGIAADQSRASGRAWCPELPARSAMDR